MIGIFFFIDGKILMDAVPVKDGEPNGYAIQHGSHYEFWETLIPKTPAEWRLKSRAYDAYPRGSVVYFPKKKKFRICHDVCIGLSDVMPLIIVAFKLIDADTEFYRDEHYKCAKCNPYYLD